MAQLRTRLALATLLGGIALVSVAQAKTSEPASDTLLVKRNYKAAFEQLSAAAKGGDSKAMFKLSSAYRYGLGTTRSMSEAQNWLEASAKAGNVKAKLALKRFAVEVPATVKKKEGEGKTVVASGRVDFNKIPPRPTGGPGWAEIAAAQKDRAALTALSSNGVGGALLVSAALGDAATIQAMAGAVSGKDGLGRDAVMLASAAGKGEALDALLAAKPDLAGTDKTGQSAAALAAAACDSGSLSKLAKAGASLTAPAVAPIVAQRCDSFAPFSAAFQKADLNAKDGSGRSAVSYAAERGKVDMLDGLAKQGADLAAIDGRGFSPLHLAAKAGKAEAIRYLLANGAPASAKSTRGVTSLMLAAASGCIDCIKALLDSRPPLDDKDADGDTALMFAVRGLQGDAAQLLGDSGANPNAKNNSGDAPGKLVLRLKGQAAPN